MLSVKAVSGENSSQSTVRANVGRACRSLGARLCFALGIAAGLFSPPLLATKPAAAQDALAGRSAVIAQPAEAQPLTLGTKIALGDVRGRIDHMAIDPVRNRLFVAELGNDSVGVVDLAAGKVIHRIAELTEPQGVAYELSTDMLYVANGGDGSVRMYGGADFTANGRIELGDDADNIRVDAARQRLLVGYGEGAIAAIDLSQRRKIAEFALHSHPESFQRDPATGWIFVNVPKAAAIVVIDGLTGKQVATWPLKGAGGNFPMALDETRRRVLVAFRAPPRFGVFSMADGQSVANADLCGDADDVFVDAKRNRAYVSCGQGFIDVVDLEGTDYRRLARVPTVPGARTAYFAPALDRLFLAVRATASEPAAIWVYRPEP
jgi:YVTN family beta-propeller protein